MKIWPDLRAVFFNFFWINMNNLKLGKLLEEFNIYAMMLEELEKVVFMHDTDLLVRIDWSDLNDGWEVLIYRETTRDNIWLFEELDRAIVKGEAIDAVLFFNKNGAKT